MSSDFTDSGLRLDQAPPLSIPLSFFLTAPLFLLSAAALLIGSGSACVLSRYMWQTIALTHLGSLGVLAMVMFGALYQMTPVVAGAPVPMISLARVVHAALIVGTGALVFGVVAQSRALLYAAFSGIGVAWLGFVIPVGIALARSPARGDFTVRGMRLSLGNLVAVGVLGIWMAHGHAGMHFPGPRALWMNVHLGLGLLGFVGTLISAVSFQVLPMFYLTPQLPDLHKRRLLLAVLVSCIGSLSGLVMSRLVNTETLALLGRYLPYVFVPAALAVWVALPMLTLRALALRKRKRQDASLRFWRAGLLLGPVTFLLALAAFLGDDPRFALGFGFIALFGWALLLVHGMLYRIVPFLIWFHRVSPLVGEVPVPSAAKLLPESFPRLAFALHTAALGVGALAFALRSDVCARLTGILLAALALQLLRALVVLARYTPPRPAAPQAATRAP